MIGYKADLDLLKRLHKRYPMAYIRVLVYTPQGSYVGVHMYFEDNPCNMGTSERSKTIITNIMLLDGVYIAAVDAIRQKKGDDLSAEWLCAETCQYIPDDELERRAQHWLDGLRWS